MKRFFILGALSALPLCAQVNKTEALSQIDANKATYEQIALKIWDYAEIGYREVKSSGLLQEQLKKEGFSVEAGVAGMPTAFVATFGSGAPVVGILAEFDALPGLSQDSTFTKKPVIEAGGGHACGHHLFGTASVAAAAALKNWLQQTKKPGTVKLLDRKSTRLNSSH